MVIDDEKEALAILKKILTEKGYRVYDFDSGENALRTFKKMSDSIDLVILDIVMPKMGGEEVLKEMLKTNLDVRVLLASEYLRKEQHRELIELGAKDFIGKPFAVDALLTKVREVIG